MREVNGSPDGEHDRVAALLGRAAADVERGEPWRARDRLRAYLANEPFDPGYARMLGELERAAGNLPEAGRWLWIAGSELPEHATAMQRFLARYAKARGHDLWRLLPRSLRRGIGGRAPPPHVVGLLRERGFDLEAALRRVASAEPEVGPVRRWLMRTLGGAGCLLFMLILLLGLRESFRLIRWLLDF